MTLAAREPLVPPHEVDLACLGLVGSSLFSAGGDPFGGSARGFVKRWDLASTPAAEPTSLVATDKYFSGTPPLRPVRRRDVRARAPCMVTLCAARCARVGGRPLAAMVVRTSDVCVVAAGKDGQGVLVDGRSGGAGSRELKLDRGATIAALALAGPGQALLASGADRTVRLWDLHGFSGTAPA